MPSIRKLFTDAQVKEAMFAATVGDKASGRFDTDYVAMALLLSNMVPGIQVSRQNARYWSRQFENTKPGGGDYLTLAQANRALRETKQVRQPSVNDDLGTAPQSMNTDCILFITDTHSPYHHPDLLEFLYYLKQKYQPTMVVHGGDELDQHAMSFHDSDPNLASAGHELELAKPTLHGIHELFPDMRIVHSNHGSMIFRRALAHGIPVQYLKSYREVLFPKGGGEAWSWHEEFRVTLPNGQDVQFQHEAGGNIISTAAHERCNLCVGHQHSEFNIEYAASKSSLYWGLKAGCLVDKKALAFAYGKKAKMRPIIGCAVIENSLPKLVPMLLGAGGRWVGGL